jgi:hypothetical protein
MEYFKKPAEETFTTHKPTKPQSANSAAKEKPIGPAPVKAADSKQGDPQKPVLASNVLNCNILKNKRGAINVSQLIVSF